MDYFMKERLASQIYNELEKDILKGFYPVNSKLPPERELAERFNTSRFVIREAIAMLINAGLAETRPQSGTFIKNFYDETTLDSLIKILQTSKSMEVRTFESLMNYKLINDVANIGRAAETMTKEDLDLLETLILKKKLNSIPRVLAECDYQIDNEIAKAAKSMISLAVNISLKPLKVYATELLYKLSDCRDLIIENDVLLFNALAAHDSKKAMSVMRDRIFLVEEIIMKHAVVENGMITVDVDNEPRKKGKHQAREHSVKSK